MYLNRRAQSTLEYAIVVVVIVAALLSINAYIKRGVQGKLRASTDEIGDQFSPGMSVANYKVISHSKSTDKVEATGAQSSALTEDQTRKKTGSESTGDLATEPWPQ